MLRNKFDEIIAPRLVKKETGGIFRAKVVKRLGQNKQQIAMYGAVTAAGGKGKKKETGAGLALSNIVLDTESIPFRLAGESFKKKKESFFFKN